MWGVLVLRDAHKPHSRVLQGSGVKTRIGHEAVSKLLKRGNMWVRNAVAALAGVLMLASCGDDSSGPTGPADIAGTWDLSITAGPTTVGATLVLVQTGRNVTGTGQSGAAQITAAGTIDGRALSLEIDEAPPCFGRLSLRATVNVATTTMSGTISGVDCRGSISGAPFSGVKDP
jgi:hypothetical protein